MRTRLLGLRDLDAVVQLFAELGYDRPANPIDLGIIPLPGADRAMVSRSSGRRRLGYGVCFVELSAQPRSWKPLARAIRDQIHDRPIGVVGIADLNGRWEKMVVIRPRSNNSKIGFNVTTIEIELDSPTQHDASVLSELAWTTGDLDEAHHKIDSALDTRATTNRFFDGLKQHYNLLVDEVQKAIDDDISIAENVTPLGDDPAERVALRILTQVLFVQFLQRKGFVEDKKDWMTWAYRTKSGPYYQTILERLFYAGLGTSPEHRRTGDPAVPYLNGGLFERFYGNVSLPIDDKVFDINDGLLGFLDRWSFTVHEGMPDEDSVGVDPEMLGKVFEHLAGEESIEVRGTVYTPRPVVHFMCKEALVPWVADQMDLSEHHARTLVTDPEPFSGTALGSDLDAGDLRRIAREAPQILSDLRVIDPAVGSGAFLLGMLSEIIRLKTVCFKALNQDEDPAPEHVLDWKKQAIQHSLFGVDIEPRAIELCRLRLWLSLIVELPDGESPPPLPNLEYRTVVADSLTDFFGGIEIQNTRGGLDFFAEPELARLHGEWFSATGDEKANLDSKLRTIEDETVHHQLTEARIAAPDRVHFAFIDEIAARFDSRDREFPCFVPALHAPDIAENGGWDIVIMNPPYQGKKEVSRRLSSLKVSDLKSHYGNVNDLMIHFATRARQLVRSDGIICMIFNDSINNSTDADEIRRTWVSELTLLALARTRCFEGKAITGGVVVAKNTGPSSDQTVRWIEGHSRPVEDFFAASNPDVSFPGRGLSLDIGELESWRVPLSDYGILPHRPLFRPSSEALHVLNVFDQTDGWGGTHGWRTWDKRSHYGWKLLSNTRRLTTFIREQEANGHYSELQPGSWVLLGLVVEGGQGLATADDRRFLAAIAGTDEAEKNLQRQERFEKLTLDNPSARSTYERYASQGREIALLQAWDNHKSVLRWPRTGGFRVIMPDQVRMEPLTDEERKNGIRSGPHFVPFEKGDDSDSRGGHTLGAKWTRDNPVVIDWSFDSVSLLRARAKGSGSGTPYFRNEQHWFREGVTWNSVASYLRCRLVSETAIFGHMAPTIRSTVPWLSSRAIMAILNTDIAEFIVRTFLGSRMHIEIGDIRRLPIPVLSSTELEQLENLAAVGIDLRAADADQSLNRELDKELNSLVNRLYGISNKARLWVVR